MGASQPKALIVAAGKGSRLNPYTHDKPKCMIEFGGKTLLQHQLDVFHACGVSDISLVRGYRKEEIRYERIRYYENPDFERNNVLLSLFCAEPAIEGRLLITYSDILFERQVVERLIESDHDISIVVDVAWLDNYRGRLQHPISEAETVVFDANQSLIRIGKHCAEPSEVHGEFIGMTKLSPRGAELLKAHFRRARTLYGGKRFQRAASFENAYLTDMMQEMVQQGVPIHCVTIRQGWKEIDTVEDYEKAILELDRSLRRVEIRPCSESRQ